MTTFTGYLSIIFFLVTLAIPIILVVLVYKLYKKNTKRAEERLNLEKQQTFNLQRKVDELNERVVKIENLLKEVD